MVETYDSTSNLNNSTLISMTACIITSLVNFLVMSDVNYEVIPTKIQGLSERLLGCGSWCKWLSIVCLDLVNTF